MGGANSFVVRGDVAGWPVSILFNTGCTHTTLVRSDFVSSSKINRRSQVQVSCCHGDVGLYPTANVRVTIDGKIHHVKTGVMAHLPQPVLLGQNVSILHKLVQDKVRL